MSYRKSQHAFVGYEISIDAFGIIYQHKSPRRRPVIVRQMPHEEAHNAAHDQTRQQLEEAQQVERHARIIRRRGLRAAMEGLEHGEYKAGF